jgi:NADPH2:quinone reductase
LKAIICPAFGSPALLRFMDVPEPAMGSEEVLVRIAAAGVNYPDLLSVEGTYPIPSKPPFIPGIEGAGVVEACGSSVRRLTVGDRICWQNNKVKGSFAERLALPEIGLAHVPDSLGLEIAACVPTVFGTAKFALVHRAELQKGETLVVHGATGGTGLAAVQLGKRLGATVIATGRTAEKLTAVSKFGADHVLVTGTTLHDDIRELTGGKGADVVFDPVGGALFDTSIRSLAPYGRLLVIGFTSGRFGVAHSNILLIKGISVIGVNYGHFLESEPVQARDSLEATLREISAGNLCACPEEVLHLADCGKALEKINHGQVTGKIALRP